MLWLLAIVPVAAASLLLLAGRLPRRGPLAAWGVATMLVTLILAALAVPGDWTATWTWSPELTLKARLDRISATMAVLVPLIALPVLLYAAVQEADGGLRRLVALLIAFVGAMELLVVADDLLTLLVGWELVGACSWALIGHHWQDRGPPRDAITAFLVTRFGDLGLFLAAMATFAATGSFDFQSLADLDGATLELVVAGIVVAAAAKSAQLPFSLWLFNAMSGPSAVSALLHAATMVAAGAYLLARLHPQLDQVSWFGTAVIAIGLTTALAGGMVAVLQSHVKKLLAASTSAHFGLMLVAVGAGYPAVAMLHLVAHAGFKSLLFMAAGIASDTRHTHLLALMKDGPRLPLVAALAACGTAALVALPPLGAAWTKEMVTASAAHHGTWLGAGVLLAGGLSAVYGLRWQWLALPPGRNGSHTGSVRPPWGTLTALAIPAALTLVSALVWLPPLHDAVGTWFRSGLPSPAAWEKAAAALLLAAGGYAGYWLARTNPHLGRRTRSGAVADWFGLPLVLQSGVAAPVAVLARQAARFDDRVLDRAVMAVGTAGRRLSRQLSRSDDRHLDAVVRDVADLGRALAGHTAVATEAVADGLVEGVARYLSAAGEDSRNLETGLAHHYLSWMAVGMALLILVAGLLH